jgi:hypothetical protein
MAIDTDVLSAGFRQPMSAGHFYVSHHQRIRMSFALNIRVLLLGFAAAFCAAPAQAAPWFLGEFRGVKPESPADPQMLVVCRADERCSVLASRAGNQPKAVEIPIKGPPKFIDTAIPNNNLETTRDSAASSPDWYEDPSFGPILRPLRAILQAQSRFAECVDLDGTAYLAMCSLSTDPEAIRSVVLLLNTMNGSCGRLPFCAYYFLPLERVSGR